MIWPREFIPAGKFHVVEISAWRFRRKWREVSSWRFRRGGFGVEVSARRFRRGRFGTVAGLTLTWERRNVVVGNHHWSSLGTTSNPPWEPPLVFLGNHQWFFSGTTNGLPWEPPMVLLGNHQWSSLGTTQCWLWKIFVGAQYQDLFRWPCQKFVDMIFFGWVSGGLL